MVKERVNLKKLIKCGLQIALLAVIFFETANYSRVVAAVNLDNAKEVVIDAPQRFKMASLDIEIDGKVETFLNGDVIYAFNHQKLKIIDSSLYSKYGPSYVNLVGLTNPAGKNPLDDRGVEFTGKDLISSWAINEEKSRFRIEIKKKKYISGIVYLEFVKPVIEYVEIFINSKKRILRDHDILTLNETDQFKVGKIKLNLPSSKQLDYKILKLNKSEKLATIDNSAVSEYKYYELVFTLENKVLITFPMKVRNK
jgi:hypothetical protein